MEDAAAPSAIRLRGVRQNNLKNFDLDLPLGRLIVVTGLSGAGKSSLVFETLHAEGQRRYVETFSPYARQFMDRMDRPEVDTIENIRPSIAIEQTNTVKTSRSTVGTMTELTDYFKVWFHHVAELFDPATGEKIESDHPASIWAKARARFPDQRVLLCFAVERLGKLSWTEVIGSLIGQGYTRIFIDGQLHRLQGEAAAATEALPLDGDPTLMVVQDRLTLADDQQTRFIESAQTALHFGQGTLYLLDDKGGQLAKYMEGLQSPVTGQIFRPAQPNLFSFNSPIGACPTCRGFGRVIEIDDRLVIPDASLSIADGVIKAFSGAVYSESQKDLMRAAKKYGVPTKTPWRDLSEEHQRFVMEGEPGYGTAGKEWPHAWYGVRRFFEWLESNTYKMHVRVFLSKYRAYMPCKSCDGTRLQPEALNWKWRDYRLPDLYLMPVSELLQLMEAYVAEHVEGERQVDLALHAILTRLRYLDQVGLGYLTLDRSSRSLSGGETQRVNLTSCLGTALVDTLFVLDEPSIGLHARDIDRLVGILRRLTDQGNTVVVVEHDESVMRAADLVLEVGPKPGKAGGEITYFGPHRDLHRAENSITAAYLTGKERIALPKRRRKVEKAKDLPWLHIRGATKHNLQGLDLDLPLQRLVVLSGVSGSGKSTLLDNVLYQGWLNQSGRVSDDPAQIERLESDTGFSEVVRIDQGPVTRTPRSNPALFVDAWDPIRTLFTRTEAAQQRGLQVGDFSFNSGEGRCSHCEGLGYERVEMQFMADVFVECPVCEGRRFKPEILEITWQGHSVADLLEMTVDDALQVFAKQSKIKHRLGLLQEVGLGYLMLGQPLNTLSGGESQRLKLVKYLGQLDATTQNALILLDEPTTGLHRHDIRRLLGVLQRLVDQQHSLIVIEHQMDMLAAADWVVELGPEAGAKGGEVVFEGTPEALAREKTATSGFLAEALAAAEADYAPQLQVAEAVHDHGSNGKVVPFAAYQGKLEVEGARQHNLKNLTLDIQHRSLTVVTGVSGSGKSSLAFDIVFAEGQRRFMESMSAWARQYVEQLPRPEIDDLRGIPPTVAIEQRVTHGTRKSTVATITEVAQYLRLLYARLGTQHSPTTGEPLVALSPDALTQHLDRALRERLDEGQALLYLCAPLIRGRKGHHQPLANWARDHDFKLLRIDGSLVPVADFEKLDRYREHDIEVVFATARASSKGYALESKGESVDAKTVLADALKLGKGACFLAGPTGRLLTWFSTQRTDPATGEAFPELDPKHFSWNSNKGWCPTCRGYGYLYSWMGSDENWEHVEEGEVEDGQLCPTCHGERLHAQARAVYLHLPGGRKYNLPQLLRLTPNDLLETMRELEVDKRGEAILRDLRPEIEERLKFMDAVGLEYLTLDRSTHTLSGGEAQRIRLASQLGSNLSGVLYVLDEPSIGLHARDNERLIASLNRLKEKGNTLLVVEHDEDTMRAADCIIDLGPGAGHHGGELLAMGTLDEISEQERSLTGHYLARGIPHPLRGNYRPLPKPFKPRSRKEQPEWLVLEEPRLRNLKGHDLHLPTARLVMVCGISGAGKSTLIRDTLKPTVEAAIKQQLERLPGQLASGAEGREALPNLPPFKRLRGGQPFRAVIEVDQSPIGKTPRSTPATYIGAFDLIREHFGQLPEAKMHAYGPSTFSFNTKGGRCETCKGAGRVKLEMNFMPDTYVDCDDCHGGRYGPELEEIRWKGKNIREVLAMDFEEAAEFFSFSSRLQAMLQLMVDTGLGYLTLGQSSNTLSGGEAQRVKLVSELARYAGERPRVDVMPRNLYILEEPTIGLHLRDCERLIELLQRLVDQGHTVVVIEHHLDLIAEADYVVEVGPTGGEAGGEILYQGPLHGLLEVDRSPTAPFLRDHLSRYAKGDKSLQ
ncbi:MAG: excinuclease ABC subunit UvrA [Verrucomicrobiota bacterium JB022]|nr:excinuclease ABC subunit UvrA [Verrucomicrobiota bacterium JB022]